MSDHVRYRIARYRHAYSNLYTYALIDTGSHDATIQMTNSKQPVAPKFLRDRQALLNTHEYLDR